MMPEMVPGVIRRKVSLAASKRSKYEGETHPRQTTAHRFEPFMLFHLIEFFLNISAPVR